MKFDNTTPDNKPKEYGGWETIRDDIGGFKYGKNDAIVVILSRLTKGNDSTYWYTIKEHYIGKDGKSYPKPRVSVDKWGKQHVSVSISIRADDKERLDNWIKIFEDIAMDIEGLRETLHDPDQEPLRKEEEIITETDPLESESGEPF